MIPIPLTPELPSAECADYAIVLDAAGIPYERRTTATGTSLWVQPEDHSRALDEVRQYQRENRRPTPPVAWPKHPHALYGVIGYAAVLVIVTFATLVHAGQQNWKSAGVLDAGFLERGEWWRVLTALTLHGDVLHLLSNLAFGAIFGYPAARLFGPGVAWLLILVGGAVAYGIDALLHPPTHHLLGASTAVFTALGLVAAYGWRRHLQDWSPWMRRSAPLIGGIALLAFTGTGGENTDVLAHFVGFGVGSGIGALCAKLPMPAPGRHTLQWMTGLAAVALIAIAWAFALA
ncbi:MAG TPA: rhomboid family intramembrane serine protease [Steroidobacteraceae bacterium]|nr:rhomboid family intramembrane serine protease [Steroidobacteraceae bacterium]